MKISAKTRLLAKQHRPLTEDSSGSYVCVLPDDLTKARLIAIASMLNISLSYDQVEDLHSTIVYARGCFPKDPTTSSSVFGAMINQLQYWDGHDNEGYLVIILDSPQLVARNRYWAAQGLEHSFEDYTPHVTLATGIDKNERLIHRMNLVTRKISGTPLAFINETLEGLKPSKAIEKE